MVPAWPRLDGLQSKFAGIRCWTIREEIEMARFRLNAITADAVSALAILASVLFAGPQAAAQERATHDIRQIASNLYFPFDSKGRIRCSWSPMTAFS